MPSPDTLSIKPIRGLVKKYLHGSEVSVDPFARNCTWATYTNDLSPDTAARSHTTAREFLLKLEAGGVRPDLCIFDPPYSSRQMLEVYQSVGIEFGLRGGQIVGRWTEERDCLARIMPVGGIVLSFGWNSNGMGLKRGYRLLELLLVPHGGAHNDTICTVERKTETPPQLF